MVVETRANYSTWIETWVAEFWPPAIEIGSTDIRMRMRLRKSSRVAEVVLDALGKMLRCMVLAARVLSPSKSGYPRA